MAYNTKHIHLFDKKKIGGEEYTKKLFWLQERDNKSGLEAVSYTHLRYISQILPDQLSDMTFTLHIGVAVDLWEKNKDVK